MGKLRHSFLVWLFLALLFAAFLAQADDLTITQNIARLAVDVDNLKNDALRQQADQRNLDQQHQESFNSQALTTLALQRLALQPKQASLPGVVAPVDEARRKAVLAAILPNLLSVVQERRMEREKLEARRSHLVTALSETRKSLAQSELLVDGLTTESGLTLDEIRKTKNNLASLNEELISIEGLLQPSATPKLAGLSLPAPQANRPSSIEDLRPDSANLSQPVPLKVITRFGKIEDQLGTTTKGIYIRTEEQASVAAPQKGLVTFAGNFRGYGKIIIVEHDATHHSVLSGLTNLSVNKGEWVRRGQILGYMGTGATKATQLYYELRIQGVPVDPLPWLNG